MDIKGVETKASYLEATQYAASEKKANKSTSKTKSEKDEYVKSKSEQTDSTKQIYSKDNSIVERLKQDAAMRKQQLINLVQQSLSKQGKTYNTLADLFTAIQTGELKVDPAAIEQAKKDVAEDGYWGVEQTSDRLVEFAKALTGGDASKADEMIAAVEKGFEEATSAWGKTLPSICSDTVAATREKLKQWKEELNNSTTSTK